MKIKLFQVTLLGLMLTLLVQTLFVVPASYAQSFQIWSNPINLSNAGSSTNPSLVIDATGTIHVVWMDLFDGFKYVKSADGIQWTDPKVVTFPFSTLFPISAGDAPEAPILLADSKGGVHALWIDKNTALYYSTVSVSAENDLTASWSTRMKLADSVIAFDAVMSSNDILHVGYVSSLGKFNNPVGVFYRRVVEKNWSVPNNLYASQYFRSLTPEEANVHLAVAESNELDTVYMVWDDRPQKKILFSKSLDSGDVWEDVVQVRSSEGGTGSETLFNINVGVLDKKLLLSWQSGLLGSQCTQYSQWSVNGGDQFSPPEKMFGDKAGCPQESEFIKQNNDFSLVMLNNLGDLSFIAWDGSGWSKSKIQNEIATFENPVTLDSVIFGCQKIAPYENKLYMVGCDKGSGGDVWFSSRTLGTRDDWFPSSLAWSSPAEVLSVNQKISALSSVSDIENNVHMFWVQTPFLDDDLDKTSIQYMKWDGESWSNPSTIISGLTGVPIQLKVVADSQKRLLITWIDSRSGDLLFTWTELNRASTASGWEIPQYIPSESQINRSPNILVDDVGKIIIVYAVPINENRGIYFVQSDDGGLHWTSPHQAFDAASADWDIVDQPDIILSSDGSLHLLFKRYSFKGEQRQLLGLYYSRSTDGGYTWADPEVVSEQPVPWSDIVSYDKKTLHRIWQELNQSTLVSFHQISQDYGVTWSTPVIISNAKTSKSLTAETMDIAGNLYFLQLIGTKNANMISYRWDGSSWTAEEPRELPIKDQGTPLSIAASVSFSGHLIVSVLSDYSSMASLSKNDIMSLGKTFSLPEEIQHPNPAVIPPKVSLTAIPTSISNIAEVSTEIPPVGNTSNFPFPISKNLVGLLLLGGILFVVVLIFRPVKRKQVRSNKPSR